MKYRHFITTSCVLLMFSISLETHAENQTSESDHPKHTPLCQTIKLTGNIGYDETLRRYCAQEDQKVVGGEEADDGAYPWQVSLG